MVRSEDQIPPAALHADNKEVDFFMRITDVYTGAPGSRFLISCPVKAQEDMVTALCAAMPEEFRRRTRLNVSPIASMDLAPDDSPSRFNDLLGLCGKLITSAGQRSHFEGLLLLNVSALAETGKDSMRLRALGEMLATPDGLASRCITVIYGPHREKELLACADDLDFDGRLKVLPYEQPARETLSALLEQAGLSFADAAAEKLMKKTLKELGDAEGFSAGKLVRICGNGHGLITAQTIRDLLDDPYSYINRARKNAGHGSVKTSSPRIGFLADR
ncbi:MAG: hypothetical protein IJ343_15165 [Clostridia bacterium]|nr:hypothetical protein [Clostridia bacterium]